MAGELDAIDRRILAAAPRTLRITLTAGALGGLFLLVAPWMMYPVFLMKLLCFALLAASLNLMIGYVGLLSFGHAMFYGSAAYVTGHVAKAWGWDGSLAILAGVAGLPSAVIDTL